MTGGSAAAADPIEMAASASSRRLRVAGVLRDATRWTVGRPDILPASLLAFLLRGGLVVVAIPFLVLPSPIGIASWVGADAITAAGPTGRFVALASAFAAVTVVAAVASIVLAAAADRVVLGAWAEDAGLHGARGRGAVATIARIVAIRLVAAIPPLVATAWAVPRVADATYRALTLPEDLATPLALRVASMVPDALAALVVGILVGELVAGLATVHVVADGDGAARSLVRIGSDLLRRSPAVLGAFAVGIVLLVAGLGVPLAAGSAAWSEARRALAEGGDPVGAILGVVGFVGALVAALAIAAAVAAWRRASLAAAAARTQPRRIRPG